MTAREEAMIGRLWTVLHETTERWAKDYPTGLSADLYCESLLIWAMEESFALAPDKSKALAQILETAASRAEHHGIAAPRGS